MRLLLLSVLLLSCAPTQPAPTWRVEAGAIRDPEGRTVLLRGANVLAADGSEKPALLDAIARPYPERTAGTLESFSFDATTKTLVVTFTPDAHVTAPTLLRVPTRGWPNGALVTCDGCTATQTSGLVTVTATGATATVTLRPR